MLRTASPMQLLALILTTLNPMQLLPMLPGHVI